MARKAENVAVLTIAANRDYIRKSIVEEKVKEMKERLELEGGVWPFPPVTVRHFELPLKDGTDFKFELLDGANRVAAATQAGYKTVPAIILICEDDEADAIQIEENISHGTNLDRDERNRMVKKMADDPKNGKGGHGWSNARIAKRFHLSEALISRIISGKDSNASSKAKRAATEPENGNGAAEETVTPPSAPEALLMLISCFSDSRAHDSATALTNLNTTQKGLLSAGFVKVSEKIMALPGFGNGGA